MGMGGRHLALHPCHLFPSRPTQVDYTVKLRRENSIGKLRVELGFVHVLSIDVFIYYTSNEKHRTVKSTELGKLIKCRLNF